MRLRRARGAAPARSRFRTRLPLPTLVVALLELGTGVTVALCFTVWETALNERIPLAAQSRLSSFDYLASLTLMPLGYILIGPVAQQIGIMPTAIGASAVAAAICLIVTLVPGVRQLQRG